MRSPALVSLAFAVALCPALAAAQEAPSGPPQGSTGSASPAPPSSAAAPAAPVESVTAPSAPASRFTLGKWMLQAHLDAGAELHPDFVCSSGKASTCTMVTFGVGGQLLWRGLVGFGLGLYVAQGSATLPGASQLALGDRISAPLSLAVRPFGSRLLTSGDSFVNRLLAGISVEVGPALEYRRSSGTGLPDPCTVHPTQTTAGFHGALSVDVPVLGSMRGGWLAVRLSGRLLVGPDANLAPREPMPTLNETTCQPQVKLPGVGAQLFAGLSYNL